MRTSVFACSLVALTFTLTACDVSGRSGKSETRAAPQAIEWSSRTAQQLREAIDSRAIHGLDRMRFPLTGDVGSPSGQDALTASALRYARAVAMGASDPAELHEIYTLPRPRPDLRAGLAKALNEGDLVEWIDGLAPRNENYRKLSQAYLALRKKGEGQAILLPAIAEPIQPRQTDPDGATGDDTAAIPDRADSGRAAAFAVAMERMRWMERTPPATRIDVNLAAARLSYWREGKIVDTRKVVVGEPETPTPQLGSPIYRLVANPTWTVPRSIQRKEIAGKGAGYLKRNNMVWKDGWIVQQPGPKNALGLVKFDMKNGHEIYLHDTPAKQLFSEVQRQRSHGCVRVEDAIGFAEMLAKDEGLLDEWRKARATGKESFLALPREIPVRLYYQTVLFDPSGAPFIRADPYGWNDRVATALGFPASKSALPRYSGSDVGP